MIFWQVYDPCLKPCTPEISYLAFDRYTVPLGFVLIFVGVAAFCLCFLAMRQPVAEGDKRARNAS